MSTVTEAIQSALPEHGIIKDRHPFLNAAECPIPVDARIVPALAASQLDLTILKVLRLLSALMHLSVRVMSVTFESEMSHRERGQGTLI
jgi:hypothetical protein